MIGRLADPGSIPGASTKYLELLTIFDTWTPLRFPGAAVFGERTRRDLSLRGMLHSLPVAEIERVARFHGAQSVRVFGSRARGDAGPESDLDLLVGMEPGRSLLDLVAIKQDLEDLLHMSVDVVSEACLSPYLRDRILAEARPLDA